jgi:Ulp1 family protease
MTKNTFMLLVKQTQQEINLQSYSNALVLVSKDAVVCVKQYTSYESKCLQDFDAVIFVVNHNLHWKLIAIKPKSQCLEIHDSLHQKRLTLLLL